jgi:hypothetical protein
VGGFIFEPFKLIIKIYFDILKKLIYNLNLLVGWWLVVGGLEFTRGQFEKYWGLGGITWNLQKIYRSNDKDYIGYYHVRGNGDIFDGATVAQSKNVLLKAANTTVAGSISVLLDKTLKELRTQNLAAFIGR